jgi:2-haloacid dehalogenase
MADRWATFDCYGTLIDWNEGLRSQLDRLFGAPSGKRLLERYHELEPLVQAEDPSLPYRDVMTISLARLAENEGLEIPSGEADALPRSLPTWHAFPEVPGALRELRSRGWRLGILSNSDRDLIEASIRQIAVPFERAIVASEIGSYKPRLAHWRAFEQHVGRLPDAHVAASLFHDVAPANELGLRSVWINRLGEGGDPPPTRELPTLTGLADVLDGLVPG